MHHTYLCNLKDNSVSQSKSVSERSDEEHNKSGHIDNSSYVKGE